MPERDPTAPLSERRILVYGVTGAGKSTAAARLGAVARLPVHLADELTWLPGWVPVETETQRATFAAIAASDAWVLDTAYSGWLDLVLPRCELVVALDYPRWRSLARLLRRTVVRIVDRRPVCNGNVETLRGAVSRDSIIAWHFRSFPGKRDRVEEWSGSPDVAVLRIRRPADLERWFRAMESEWTA